MTATDLLRLTILRNRWGLTWAQAQAIAALAYGEGRE
jgi:hypothetical protein